MNFLIATHNMKKRDELSRILGPLGINVVTAEQAGLTLTEAEETGTTFEENAYIKAKSGCEESNMPCIADDSGLMVDALSGAPGVYSARFSGEHGNDEANIDKLLSLLSGVPEEKRTARFKSAVCCVFPNGDIVSADGVCEGRIGFERRGKGGFGYDPVFMVGDRSFSQLSSEEKDSVSHRGKALAALAAKLEAYLKNKDI
ncbi:MAG: RdgB/HAM1 family non-canonical purine NTP pyrophosphatase [Acutalibacteraceae bacterium]|nr:RdgB/HAM1 family non-canonical purine NTP pyrophosphatase [Oscillospiraceae bacterium]